MNQEPTFGSIVKERRQLLGLTQAELGRRVGCAAITIRKIEADSLRPSVQIAEHLAVALNIPEEEHLAFIRLARAERELSPIPTPEPIPAEIGQEDLSGRAIRGFELGERIGTGGYGVVYRARQVTVERDVAIKIILPEYADRPDFIRRFESEAQLVARLEHPHIVPLYDYWREPGVAYLIMRLLRGGSLEDRLRSGPIDPAAILQIMKQVSAGLYASHQAGVIHRDIKPANILLDDDGNAYLADFGIAKHMGNGKRAETTIEGTVFGSPAYISPEQILAEPVKPQTDIYSMGVVLYELLAGHKPFKGPTPFAYIQQHLNEPLPLLAAADSDASLAPHLRAISSSGQPLPTALDIVIGRATSKDARDRYPDILTMLADLRRAMKPGSTAADLAESQEAEKTPAHVAAMIELPDLENPYKGLRAFTEADAADFFGRQTLIQDLLARLAESNDLSRFLAVVGPSGSGKSSVVRAGLIPALRQGGLPASENWFITEMLPGAHPLEELEAALLRVAINPPESLLAQLQQDERGLLRAVRRILPGAAEVELLLVIDQFEELFTLVADEALRQHFLDSLVTAMLDPRSRLRLVITLRADFTDQPLRYVDFGDLVRQRSEFVLPLTPDELEQAIIGPTERTGLRLEPELVPTIVREIGDQPGTLPLLQYALTELFERRVGRMLTLTTYRASGGVLGALARRADELYAGLDESGKEMGRQLFLRLVTLGEGTEDTRRRVLRSELSGMQTAEFSESSAVLNSVIDQFGHYRLLTFDRDPVTRGPTAEVAHEALLREWGRLRGWLDQSRADVRLQRLLASAAEEWLEADQDPGYLLRGSRLNQFEGWAASTDLALTQDERAYLETSLAARQEREAAEEARLRRELETAQKLVETEKHAARRLRWLAMGLVTFLIVAVGLSVFAFNQQAQAEANQAEAEANLALSESQRLAAEANALIRGDGDPELAALLSLRAMNTAYTSQADIALQQVSKKDYGRRLFTGHTDCVNELAFSPDGQYALSGSNDDTARIWEVQTGRPLHVLTEHTAHLYDVAFSPNGHYVLTGSDDGTAKLWEVESGELLHTLTGHEASVQGVAFSSDGQYALTGSFDVTARLWEVETGQEVRIFDDPGGETDGMWDVAFSPDGHYILLANDIFNEVGVWDSATGQRIGGLSGASGGVLSVTVSPDGRYVLASDGDGFLRRWNLEESDSEPLVFRGQHSGPVGELTVSPDGQYALSASDDLTARLWDIDSGQEVRRFASVTSVESVAFSPDGRQALIGYGDGVIRLWDVQPPSDPRTFRGHTNVVAAAKISPDGRYILTGGHDNTARLWDALTGQELHLLDTHTDWPQAVAFSPDSHFAATGSWDRTARLWEVETGQEVRVFSHPNPVLGVAFSPDGRYLVTGNWDGIVRLWNVETGQEVRAYEGHNAEVPAVVFSPDGRYILSASEGDDMVRLWEVETGQEVRQFPGYWGWINPLSFSPDGKYILTVPSEEGAQLWEVETGQALDRFLGRGGVFSQDGKYILTYDQKTAYLWDRATGQRLRTFGATHKVWGVGFSPDGQFILVHGSDKLARLWDTDYRTLADSVCTRLLRDFTDIEREQYGLNDQQPTCPSND